MKPFVKRMREAPFSYHYSHMLRQPAFYISTFQIKKRDSEKKKIREIEKKKI